MLDAEILRLEEARKPYSRSKFYELIQGGLMPRQIPLGPRAVGWSRAEREAVNRAIIAGCSEDEIRALVEKLHGERKNFAPRID